PAGVHVFAHPAALRTLVPRRQVLVLTHLHADASPLTALLQVSLGGGARLLGVGDERTTVGGLALGTRRRGASLARGGRLGGVVVGCRSGLGHVRPQFGIGFALRLLA